MLFDHAEARCWEVDGRVQVHVREDHVVVPPCNVCLGAGSAEECKWGGQRIVGVGWDICKRYIIGERQVQGKCVRYGCAIPLLGLEWYAWA